MNRKFRIYLNAPITLGFAFLCLIALLLQYLTGYHSTNLFFSTYASSFANPLTYVRLVGHVFGHANFEHLMSNMMYILLLGPVLEEKYHDKLIYVILVTAVITGLTNNILCPNIQLMGASGVVFAFILLASVTGHQDGIPITLILVALLWIGGEVSSAIHAKDTISQMAHIIGGGAGGIMGMAFKGRRSSHHFR